MPARKYLPLILSPKAITPHLRTANLVIIAALLFVAAGCNRKKLDFNPAKDSHIVIIGNTFAERMQYYGYFETMLHEGFPDRELVVRNMGWSGDEPNLQPRPLNFGNVHEHLADQKADIIFLCFGMNESFKGRDSLESFKNNLLQFCNELRSHRYNGRSAPQLILVSPIAHENVGGLLPDPAAHNEQLQLYTKAMGDLAASHGMGFIDLYEPSSKSMQSGANDHLTINGIHLNDKGYRAVNRWMGAQLGLPALPDSTGFNNLNKVVISKNQQFFYRWRAVNGEYIYGRRKKPFGVHSYPPEMKKLDMMVRGLDSLIWLIARQPSNSGFYASKASDITDEYSKSTSETPITAHNYPATTKQFTLAPGYSVNLFASEKDFPIEKPVSMSFDARGRLWVATMPTYPQYYPGFPPRDKIIILEDTNGDGRADKHTVFADKLYLPLGFIFGNGGVYVSEEPNMLFLKDTNGDDVADEREIVLHGFGSEDSHHATHAFTWGQDGAMYFHEGVFLNSQVETPYGPVRSINGATYRYEPRTGKLSHYVAYKYNNPWGNVFDKWGLHLIGDASDGNNYYATPMTGNIDYPLQHPPINMFTTTKVRPTAGIEIVSSRHFPDSVQGNFLVNNTIGFQGIKQHRIIPKGSGVLGVETTALLQSSDPNFRPVDLKFAPDGSLYVVDWFNPLIGHMQFSLRDPGRDKAHGRIWRITYKNRPLLKPVDLSRQTIPQLLENLKAYEDRFRYRTREQLRIQDSKKVIPELNNWIASLDKSATDYEHNLLEALWIYQDFDVVKEDLLKTLLRARDHRARAAATKVLQYWRDRVKDPIGLLRVQVNDDSARVRIEAVVALSYFKNGQAVTAALDVLNRPMDYYLNYATKETLKYLKPLWMQSFRQQGQALSSTPGHTGYLLALTTPEELLALPRGEEVYKALLIHPGIVKAERVNALNALAEKQRVPKETILINVLMQQEELEPETRNDLADILVSGDKQVLRSNREMINRMLDTSGKSWSREAGYAALISADGSDEAAYRFASRNERSMMDYLNAVSLLPEAGLQVTLSDKIKGLTSHLPAGMQRSPQSKAVNSAAIRAFGKIPSDHAEHIEYISGFMQKGSPYTQAAAQTLLDMPDSILSQGNPSALIQQIMSIIETTPDKERNQAGFNTMIKLGKKITPFLEASSRSKINMVLESTGIFQVGIATLPSKMLFDKNEITIPAGRPVEIKFTNPDEMPHNFVIIQNGSQQKVGKAADAMASSRDGFERNFVPEMPEVLYSTPLVNPGDDYTLSFTAPGVPGEYMFICSFPGHWVMMKGIIRVIAI